jgi:hypothetical protein
MVLGRGRPISVGLFCVLVILFLAACSHKVAGVDWNDPWSDNKGKELPRGYVYSQTGPSHCEWESVIFLSVNWISVQDNGQIWQTLKLYDEHLIYIRDPENLVGFSGSRPDELETYTDLIEVPEAISFTGYKRDGASLWANPSSVESRVYVVFGDRIERWPRFPPEAGCA